MSSPPSPCLVMRVLSLLCFYLTTEIITSYQGDHISSKLAGQALLSGCLCLNKQEIILKLHYISVKNISVKNMWDDYTCIIEVDVKQRRQRVSGVIIYWITSSKILQSMNLHEPFFSSIFGLKPELHRSDSLWAGFSG